MSSIPALLDAAASAPTPEIADALYRQVQGEATRQAIVSCTACPLHESSTQRVPFRGSPSPIAIVGEAPGAVEDRSGFPFWGKAGQLLSTILARINVPESSVAILNTICCRPPRNNYDHAREVGAVEACDHHFRSQLAYLGSWVLVVMGNSALSKFYPPKPSGGFVPLPNNKPLRISEHRGKPRWVNGYYLVPTFHPAYALRNRWATDDIALDLSILPAILAGERDTPVPKSYDPLAAIGYMRSSSVDPKGVMAIWRKRHYVVVRSAILNDEIVVTRDASVIPEAKFYHLPRYTVAEVERLRRVGSQAHLRRVHLLKRELGVEVMT